MADKTGVNIETLRYYEREGLINTVERASNGHRRYSAEDVFWIEVLRCLRDTGMSIEQLRQYCDLGAQGDHTQPERMALLVEHKQQSITLIDHKIDFYKKAIAEDEQ